MIKLFDFDPNMSNLHKQTFQSIDIYYIGYVAKKEEYKISSVNPLSLLIYKIDGFIEEKRGNKYLNIAFTDNNDEVLKKYKDVLDGSKNCIEKISNNRSG